MMTKHVAYYRVSTDKQGRSGLGLDAQRNIVVGVLGGVAPVSEFIETESGRKDDRPELAAALSYCRVHKATLVIAKLDRLSRSHAFLNKLADDAEAGGVPLKFCDIPELPVGAAGWLMLRQMGLFAEFEARLISERTKAALRAKVERDGQWDRKSKHHLVPGAGQKKAAATVSKKAKDRASDLLPIIDEIKSDGIVSLGGIAKALNERGITTARGGQWQPVQVQRLISYAA